MPINTTRARQLLSQGDLRALFIEELGWDRHSASLSIPLSGSSVNLRAVAQKRGMVVYHCPTPPGDRLPDYARRRKIEHQAARSAHEHLIVFTDPANETQIWQWVKREPGKPAACREHTFHRSQSGEALLQKLEAIAFALEEEEALSLTDVTRRARAGFDVERVTKKFYDQFKKEHEAFLKFITGITESADHEWYASVMLNRLMFVYFIQRKGFLDGDCDYLRHRLTAMRTQQGQDQFYSFYRYFLLRLFHEGLGGRSRTPELEKLLGHIPYLNGGLFDLHELEKPERYGKTIQIPDEAFERIFSYFDQYQWRLDERPLRADNEINPDVLGYIFEKYINQKQMGAYYTKEDITEYISKNTVIPFLFDAARARCKIAFENPNGPTIWDLLKEDPDRYIYAAVRHGAEKPLPPEIAAGLDPPTLRQPVGEGPVQTLELRKGWNRPAPPEYALPTEIWREVVARRQRYQEVRSKLAAGEVRDINDLITLNLDIRQFAQDVIETCDGPDLLRAFWHTIEKVTILDPTCGSGAFLFAAVNILEPLYEACLERMQAFIEVLERSGVKHRPEKFSDFRKVLEQVASHPNRRYFIYKSIILNNLFGVDIMEEAVEICKLRLFLKLAAQVEPNSASSNFGIEPLPDIDFNIRAGNTLVGYATYEQVQKAVTGEVQIKFDFSDAMEKISIKAADLQQAFDAFRSHQVKGDGAVPIEHKHQVRKRLEALEEELNHYLAGEYGIQLSRKNAYEAWLKSHQPFHWFIEFYGILSAGGFDVIIGNPPYVPYPSSSVEYTVRNDRTDYSGNLYSLVTARSIPLTHLMGRLGLIVPMSLTSTREFVALRHMLNSTFSSSWTTNHAIRPVALFTGISQRVSIFLATRAGMPKGESWTTNYLRTNPVLNHLFSSIQFGSTCGSVSFDGIAPKISGATEQRIIETLRSKRKMPTLFSPRAQNLIHFKDYGETYWIFPLSIQPYLTFVKTYKSLGVEDVQLRDCAVATFNSSLFYWFYTAISDCWHFGKWHMLSFPVGWESMLPGVSLKLRQLCGCLMDEYVANRITRFDARIEGDLYEYKVNLSKHVLNEIDLVLARHYGFTEEELDFIINYDIKYRMGRDSGMEEE